MLPDLFLDEPDEADETDGLEDEDGGECDDTTAMSDEELGLDSENGNNTSGKPEHRPTHIIRDRDSKFTAEFCSILETDAATFLASIGRTDEVLLSYHGRYRRHPAGQVGVVMLKEVSNVSNSSSLR